MCFLCAEDGLETITPWGYDCEEITNGRGDTMIDWKRKLTSRKFWMSVASFVSMMAVALGAAESDATQISALIMAGATVIGYVIGEGLADGSHGNDGSGE